MKPSSSLNLHNNSSMAFSSALRLLTLSPFTPATRLSFLRRTTPDIRFLSASSRRRPSTSIKASTAVGRRDEPEQDGNGSLAVVDSNGSDTVKRTEGRIVLTELHKEATEAYMAYAMSVLLGRALPDVRDGLKPVHRRILFAMHELGLSSKKPFKKCARVVGEVLGKFHPHGDSAVYDSMVRMAQDFSLRSPLVNGHGNFGSIDADPPAAMRYTECRLEELAEAMLLADLDQDTVNFVPNFDNSQKEPSVLPARLPTLLLNGSSGIAVGMATNIPPHNLGEVVDVLCAIIHNPEATLQELLEYMPGPDFPTGGLIMGNYGILEAYRTGRGRVVVRGKTEVELLDSKSKRSAIIIKEIPYQTNKSALVEKIADLVENKAFLDFRCSVVERRARFQLSKAQQRRHIVEGILVGFNNLDAVIHIIREASSNSIAAAGLRNEFNLSEKQAEALLDMSLRRLTLRESDNFVAENKSLAEQISKLEELLSTRKNILELIEQEAIDLKNKFASPRRSILEDTDDGQLEDIDVIPNEEMLLALSGKGYLKRMKPNTFNLQHRGTIGKSVGKLKMNDSMSDFIVCRAHDYVLYFSDKGTVYSARAYKIPECSRTASGTPLVQILSLSDGERITSIIPVSEFTEDQFLLMLTVQGYVKRVPLNSFSSIRSTGIIATQLVPGDELKWVRCCTNDDFVAMASHNGLVILSLCTQIRTQGRNTRGAPAMRLKNGDRMASVDIIPAAMWNNLETISKLPGSNGKSHGGPWLLFISESGYGKRVPLSRFRMSSLNRVGLIGYKFSDEDCLAAVFVVGFTLAEDGESDEQVVLVSQSGTVNRIKVRDISIQSRFARGVILMRLDHAGKIQSASLISATECEPEEVLDIAQV
ncbi:DNA gyrase subunit A, chloroplastic/mitochondrial isoform X2 [Lathyrus oleraceus]|uniref:DNA gyrase subunit A, chloroplastic/mitochondrial isoform X2 n=1 Tax=Pisum sativum TaxID=3888 RepID=UPI0021CEE144|nr:DNA gyrase subunit A, chloroplastic/mitochondrial isoform X2 [Pisum sativum]